MNTCHIQLLLDTFGFKSHVFQKLFMDGISRIAVSIKTYTSILWFFKKAFPTCRNIAFISICNSPVLFLVLKEVIEYLIW